MAGGVTRPDADSERRADADRTAGTLGAAVGVNLALSVGHGAAHVAVPVPTAPWQLAVVGFGVVLAPVAGLLVVRRGRVRAGAALVAAGGAAALALEVPWHFLLANPDHVAHAGGGLAFASTALLSAAADLLVVAVAAGRWWRETRPPEGAAGARPRER
jgi:hypothetical protein